MVSQEKVVNASAISVTSPSSSSSSSPSVSSPSSFSAELAPSFQELRRARTELALALEMAEALALRQDRLALLERQRSDLISGIAAVRAQRHFRTPEQIAALRAEVGRL